jgi:hypothetical protein
MQAFFVHAKSTVGAGGTNFTLPNAARKHSTQTFWKKGSSKHANLLKINIEKDGMTDEMALRFLENAQKEFDSDFDAYKMLADGSVPQIFSYTPQSLSLAINSMPFFNEYLAVPVGFKAKEEGLHAINILELSRNDLPSDIYIYLEDKELGKMTEINQGDQYSFYTKAQANGERFVIHFMKQIPEIEGFETNVFSYDKEVVVNILTNETDFSGSVKIYNMIGVLVESAEVNSQTMLRIPIKEAGIYIVNTDINGQKVSKKVFIK